MSELGIKIKHGIKWQFVTNIVGQGIYFINGVILARILDPRDFGIYGMTQVLSAFVFVFWNLGLNSAIIQRKEVNENHLHTAFVICGIMGFVCTAIVWFAAPYIARFFKEPLISPLARIVGLTFLVYAWDRVPSALLRRNLHFRRVSLAGLVNPIVYGLVSIPLALFGFGPFSFVWGVMMGAIGTTIYNIYCGAKLFAWRPKIIFHKESAKHLLGFGMFVTMSSLISYFMKNFQRIIAGRFFGAVDLGYFTRGANLSILPLSNVQSNVSTVLLPAFSNIKDEKKMIVMWFRKFNYFTYAIIAPVLIFFMFFPKYVIVGLFGEKWLLAAPVLMWLSLSVLISGPIIYFNSIMQATGKANLQFYVNVIMLIPFTIILIAFNKWGIVGIAIALALNSIISLSLYLAVLSMQKVLSIKDVVISCFEPVLVSVILCFCTFIISDFVMKDINSPLINLLLLCSLFGVFILSYYANRWFRNNFIGYLGFNIREVMRFQ